MSASDGGETIGKRAARAVAWGYGGTAVRMAMQVGAQAILARLLGPQEFGIFAALMLLASVAVLAADLVSAPIIQAAELSETQLHFACACQFLGSVLVAALVMACLPICQRIFPNQSGLPLGLALMAAGTLFTGLSGVALSLLRRKLRYKEIQLTQLIGYFAGYVLIAIPLGLLGFHTFHVLVVAWLAQAVISSLLLFYYEPHSLKMSFDAGAHWGFLKFGVQISLGNLANWLSSSLDRLLVAKFGSPVDIGYYNTMLNLLMTPVVQVAASLNTVAFSVSSQASPEARREGAQTYLNLTALTCMVLYGALASFPSSLVSLIYGERWLSAAAYVEPFCLAAVGFAVGAAANAILTSTGKGAAVALVQTASAVLMLLAISLAVQSSVVAAAYWVAAVYALRALGLSVLSLKHVGASSVELARLLGVPILLSAGQTLLARLLVHSLELRHPLAQLGLAGLSATVILLATLQWRQYLLPAATGTVLTRLLTRRSDSKFSEKT